MRPETLVIGRPLLAVKFDRKDPLDTDVWSLPTKVSVVMPVVTLTAYIMLTPDSSCRLFEVIITPPTAVAEKPAADETVPMMASEKEGVEASARVTPVTV